MRAMLSSAPEIVNINIEALDALLGRMQQQLMPADFDLAALVFESYIAVTKMAREQGATIARLRRMIGMPSNEKTAAVFQGGGSIDSDQTQANEPPAASTVTANADDTSSDANATDEDAGPSSTLTHDGGGSAGKTTAKKKRKGHGRVPVEDYTNAAHIAVEHDERLRPGQLCPTCMSGKLYDLKKPARFLRIFGQAPLAAVCWDCQQVRCASCSKVFVATPPAAAQGPKYDESAAAMMALTRYRLGVPLNRLDHWQRNLETPVPASTQWEVVNEHAADVMPVFGVLLRLGAQGTVLHNDDSFARILAFMGNRRAELLLRGELKNPDRTGVFTTAVVSITPRGPIAIFFTGRQHAGENLADLLDKRVADIRPPLLMSDGLDRNLPKGHAVDWANCICHGRRYVVDEAANYPPECKHILDELAKVFKVEAECRKLRVSAEERLRIHRRDSGPVMDELEKWLKALVAQKRIEPNSGMGKAINYLIKHWTRFCRFLHVAGAPLENNICERILKMAIRHRNNSLFFKTQHGADVGDVYMTLICTCELNGVNPFDYLTALMRNPKAVAADPEQWLPWNYRDALACVGAAGSQPRSPVNNASPPHSKFPN
jgi:hypothetical protein